MVLASQAGLSVRDWPDLNPVRKLSTTLVNIHDMAFSPDGRSLAVAGGTPSEAGLAQILAWPGGVSSCELHGHDDSVLAVAWMNDSAIATASLDHEIVVWDVITRQPIERLKGHSRGVSNLCFLRDKDVLISSGLDQNLRVWNSKSGKMVRTLNNHTKEVHELALQPATEGLPMIASVSNDHTVRLWQPTIGRMVRFAQLSATPLAVEWLADGSQVAVAATDGYVRLIDPDTVEVLQTIPGRQGVGLFSCRSSQRRKPVGGRAKRTTQTNHSRLLKAIGVSCVSTLPSQCLFLELVQRRLGVPDEPDAVFSGPQPGEKLTALKVTLAYGKEVNKTIDLVERAAGKPSLLVIVNGSNRPAARLTRTLMKFAEMHKENLFAGVVYLDNDQTAAIEQLQQAVSWWKVEPPVGISVDGAEGPGSYGLNRNINITVLVASKGIVTSNFALVQPTDTDAINILKDVVTLTGGRTPDEFEVLFLSAPIHKPATAG